MPEKTAKKMKIAIAMSGGVDSSVTACLLKDQGHELEALFMDLGQHDFLEQVERLTKITDHLKIPLKIIDLKTEFKKQVLDYFKTSYSNGKTPNPCIICNKTVKCGLLLKQAMESSQKMATGHYASIRQNHDSYSLFRGKDTNKDQSYFLSQIDRQALKNLIFPLGQYSKSQVYELAEGYGIKKLHSPESQDICFLNGLSIADFLSDQDTPGEIWTKNDKIIGQHTGISKYTVGQRRGLGIPDSTPYYVIQINEKQNRLIVGKKEDLWQNTCVLTKINWLEKKPVDFSKNFELQIRYRHQAARASIKTLSDNRLEVSFPIPQKAVTPGQFAAIYDGQHLLGSGEIV
jgi:tRNA-uridine 2-sulfurtransferase